MKLVAALLLAVASLSWAQTQPPSGTLTSPNLVYTTKNPYQGPAGTEPYTWSGFVVTESQGGGLSGGEIPGYNPSVGQFMFGYMQGTVAYRYALSQALKNSGMTWLGYNYSWEYYNQEYSRGTLSAAVDFTADNGTVLHSKTWNLGPTTNGWTAVSGTEVFSPGLAAANLKSFGLSFTGKDDRWWAGYYGPQVRSPNISVLYTFDQCSTNPLSSPDCPGYAQAYHDQQCAANPLYATSCPGYQQAYLTLQCSANPLYSVQCPGYAQAYFDQQCQLNGLYSKECPNYATAYATQQALSTSTTTTTTTTTTTATDTTTQLSSGISDTTVSSVVTATKETTSATSPTSVIGPVSVIAPPPQPPAVSSAITSVSITPPPTPAQQQERQQDQKKTDGAVASVERKAGGDRREAGRQVAAAAKDAAEKARNATTLEAQTANQGLVVGLMGYVPGFTAYQNAIVPDALAAQVARQYHRPTVDNRSAQRQLSGANDRLHRDMVEQQYRQGQ